VAWNVLTVQESDREEGTLEREDAAAVCGVVLAVLTEPEGTASEERRTKDAKRPRGVVR